VTGFQAHRQVFASAQCHRAVHQGPLSRRPRELDRHLSGRPGRLHQPHPRWWWTSVIQDPLPHLPAAGRLHHVTPGPHHQHPPPRGHAAASPGRTARAGLGRALPGRPPHRRMQDRPLRPAIVGRPTGPDSWTPTSDHRSRYPGRGDQLGPAWPHSDWATMETDGFSEKSEGTWPPPGSPAGSSTPHIRPIRRSPSPTLRESHTANPTNSTRDRVRPTFPGPDK
jgi:hypothetical protein